MVHLEKVLGHVTGIVVVASNKEIGKHALKCQLLQQEIFLPLATKQLVDQQSRLDEVINPVPASGVLPTNLKVIA